METLENTLRHVHDWAIDRIHKLSEDYVTPESDTYESIESLDDCLLYTSPSPRDMRRSRMPSSA